ncbi:MAG: hypothetical protein HC830_02090 [Bacteroidetes bacterium]|nr:hypothetical protein [Bacteroidota bacterium]
MVVKFFDGENKEIKGKNEIVNENKISFTPDSSYNNVRVLIEGTVEVSPNPIIIFFEHTTRALLGLKNVSFSYSRTQGTLLPGYTPKTSILGMIKEEGMFAPGLPFILGFQDKDIARKAATEYGWITTSTYQNNPFLLTHNETFNGRANFEPIPGLKIELTALRTYTRNESSYYIAEADGTFPDSTRGYMRNGNFSMSFIAFGSAFEKFTRESYENSPAFEKFKSYRYKIIDRLAGNRDNAIPGYDPDTDVDGNPLVNGTKNGYNEIFATSAYPCFYGSIWRFRS